MNLDTIYTRDDILKQLASLDFRLQGYTKTKIEFVIVGGSALRLLAPSYSEVTNDIDYILLKCYSEFDTSIFADYLLNNRAAIFENNLPEDYQERMIKLPIPFENIVVYVLAPLDLIIMKLARSFPKDAYDLVKSDILSSINIDELKREYAEIQHLMIGREVGRYTVDYILDKYLEYKQTGKVNI